MAAGTEESETEHAAAPPAAVPKLLKPYFIISGYYGAIAGFSVLMLAVYPALLHFLPVGGAANFGAVGDSAFGPVGGALRPTESTLTEGVKLAL